MDTEKTKKRMTLEEKLKHHLAQVKATQARINKKERTDDTRRKILRGAFLQYHLEKNPELILNERLDLWTNRGLAEFLKRPDDIALFSDFLNSTKEDRSA